MKAVRYHEHGATDVLRHEQVERPTPGPSQVLIKVAATSFNPVDEHIRMGVLAEVIPTPLPITPGLDVSGTVSELGADVNWLHVGDRVVAMFPLDAHGGAAEYAVIDADLVAPAPREIELVDAASLPLTGLAARQAAIELANVQTGQSVLVNGAGGAVGSFVVQLAVNAGGVITAVASAKHAERLRHYGAQRVVGPLDLDAGPDAVGGPFDVVVNHVRLAPEDLVKLAPYVADGGIAVSSAGAVPADEARGTRSASVWVSPSGDLLRDLVERIDDKRLQLNVVTRRPFDQLTAVHDDAAAGALTGKTVIVVE